MKAILCPGVYRAVPTVDAGKKSISHSIAWHDRHAIRGVKRIRIKCLLCGARVWSSVSNCHDGCCIHHSLPPHKPKNWWKQTKLERKHKDRPTHRRVK